MAPDLPTDEQDPPSALPRGTLLNDKFRVQRVIGVGGFGIVYLAHDEMSDVDVAIKEYMPASLAGRTKTMHVSLSSQSNAETFALGLKSFWNEARLLAKFRDEHLPLLKVYDAFQANGTAYMVMPVLRGRTAHQLRREMSKPPTERWLRTLLTDLLPALDRLHAENVYHRDIAPDNIQIDTNGKPVLMDLGAARHVIINRTQSITAILKPGYAPIEQYGESEKLRQGPWTDIYALGATLHFLLLNKSPASATARIFDTGTPLVAHDLPGCSPAFLRVIDWMLEPRPEARPQSVEQLRTALFDSDDATVMMAPKRTVPPAAARAAAPPPPPPPPSTQPPLPQAPAPTMPLTMAATQAVPRTAGPAALAAFAPTAVAATPSASPPTASTPARVSPPAAPAPSAHAAATAGAKSPLPMVLAGVAALVLVAGAAVWLWPSSTPPAGASARTAPASAPEVSKAAPAAAPRPETPPVPATAVAPVSPPPAVAEPPQAAQPAAPAPSPPVAATPAAPIATNPTAPESEAARTAATAPTSTRRTPPTPVAAASSPAPTKKAAPINDKDGALLPKPADPSAQATAAPAPAPAPPPAPAPVAPTPVVATPPAANAVASPTERCADKGGSITRRVCVAVVCGLPELHNHAECTALRRN